MTALRFAENQRYVPGPSSASLASLGLERWLEAAAAEAPAIGDRARALAADSGARRLIEADK